MSKRRAISSVLTTMIILAASAVIATSLATFGATLFQSQSQNQSIEVLGFRIWVNSTDPNGVGWGALAIRNSGDRDLAVDNIQVRGATILFSNWYAETNGTAVNTENYQAQFVSTKTDSNGMMHDTTDVVDGISDITTANVNNSCPTQISSDNTTIWLDLDGGGPKPSLCLKQANNPVQLDRGEKTIIYFRMQDGVLSPVDSGTNVNANVFAGTTGLAVSVKVSN